MQRKSLGAVKIAARAKAKWSDLDAESFQRPAHIDKLVSIIAVVNLKGGVGKSTIAVNLACELAIHQSVVVVDADSQATATDWARRGNLPARVETLPLDADSQVGSWVEKVLTIQADHVVIDCPPHIGPATLAAVGIADMVLIPVTPSGADLVATDSALAVVHDAQATRKDNGPLCLLVPSKVDSRTASGRELAAALERFDETVAPEIGQRAALVDAFSVGAWIGQYAPRNKAREQFRDLAIAVKRRWLMELKRLRNAGAEQRQVNIEAAAEAKVA
jgi:chromosome partitioning protein